MSKEITLKPRLSEKSYAQSQNSVFVFAVPADANKHSVARAIEVQFDVKVATVNILNLKGKAKRTVSAKGRRQLGGTTSDTKKAYVTLREGFNLPIFAAEEEAQAKQEKVQTQVDKAAAKVAEKEVKDAVKKAKKEKK